MKGLVYSYTRFSDPRQATGHSAERQSAYAAKWAEERGLRLDETLTMQDEGLSAYHQRHVKSGALGVFLAAVEDGKVPPGSVLIVEGLDRLSRAEPMVAQGQLGLIVNAGITVVTASDGKEYSRERLREQPMDLIYSLLVMIRAHEESHTKSKRVTAAILKLCRGWQAGTYKGKVRNGKDPKWLKETPEGWEVDADRAETVRMAVKLYREGHSGKSILLRIAAAGMAPPTDNPSAQHLYKIFKNPNLIGTKRISAGGEDFELANYYPAVISAVEWEELQRAGDQRPKRSSATAQIPHVITGIGITYCGYCGKSMSGQNLFGKIKKRGDKLKDGYRRLLCAGLQYADGQRCPHPKSRSVAPVERAIMTFCSDMLNLRSLYEGDRSEPLRAELARSRIRASEVDRQINRLMEAMLSTDAPPASFTRKANELETERVQLGETIARIEREISTLVRTDLDGADLKWRALVDGVSALDVDARVRARQLVAETFERIVVYASGLRPGEEGDVIDLVLVAKGGTSRVLRVDRIGNWVSGDQVEQTQFAV